ncbi:hypothetical protein PR048_018569 [Dryococelus australis]|uniref:Uncharacterized protein n=1 Tax=Dryococelus australis TaxID=614101 RepID=A0ABQ9HD18_9NEOP|nr:hypothetical protein PR048_018569 [Dryococelus australis]
MTLCACIRPHFVQASCDVSPAERVLRIPQRYASAFQGTITIDYRNTHRATTPQRLAATFQVTIKKRDWRQDTCISLFTKVLTDCAALPRRIIETLVRRTLLRQTSVLLHAKIRHGHIQLFSVTSIPSLFPLDHSHSIVRLRRKNAYAAKELNQLPDSKESTLTLPQSHLRGKDRKGGATHTANHNTALAEGGDGEGNNQSQHTSGSLRGEGEGNLVAKILLFVEDKADVAADWGHLPDSSYARTAARRIRARRGRLREHLFLLGNATRNTRARIYCENCANHQPALRPAHLFAHTRVIHTLRISFHVHSVMRCMWYDCSVYGECGADFVVCRADCSTCSADCSACNADYGTNCGACSVDCNAYEEESKVKVKIQEHMDLRWWSGDATTWRLAYSSYPRCRSNGEGKTRTWSDDFAIVLVPKIRLQRMRKGNVCKDCRTAENFLLRKRCLFDFAKPPSLLSTFNSFWYCQETGQIARRQRTGNNRVSTQKESDALLALLVIKTETNRTKNPMTTKSGYPVWHCSFESIVYNQNSITPLDYQRIKEYCTFSEDREASRAVIVKSRLRLEIESQKQSSDAHKTPYDLVKQCRVRKINIKPSERVNVNIKDEVERSRWLRTTNHRVPTLNSFSANTASKYGV